MGKLGASFLACALGPVSYAGSCIMAGRVAEGLQELSAEALEGALKRGVDQLAQRVGLGAFDIERILPQEALRAQLDKLATTQRSALEAWTYYSGRTGGLLQGVADLTVDGRAPDASLNLQRLAKKVSRDKPFSQPLMALSEDVGVWE